MCDDNPTDGAVVKWIIVYLLCNSLTLIFSCLIVYNVGKLIKSHNVMKNNHIIDIMSIIIVI